VTDHTNDSTTAADPTARLVDLFATAGVEALGQGVLPDALAELAERAGGDDTITGVVLSAAADLVEVAEGGAT
jgi:hypothetical protein